MKSTKSIKKNKTSITIKGNDETIKKQKTKNCYKYKNHIGDNNDIPNYYRAHSRYET